MKSIQHILKSKSKPLASVGPEDSVHRALELMAENGVGAVLVLDNDRLAGIFTERDCVQKVSLPGRNTRETPVREVMTEKVRFVTPEQTVTQCLGLMTERFFRHLPVLDKNQNVVGIVSIGDLVKEKISEQDFIIDQMERYITS